MELDYVDLSLRFLEEEEELWLRNEYPNIPLSVDDGCPTCHGSKHYVFGGEKIECECEQQVALHRHYSLANIGELYQRLDWNDYDGDDRAKNIAQGYVEKHDSFLTQGMGLIYYGPFGTGKTMLVSLVAKELVKLGYSVYFTTFPEMIELFTAGWVSDSERKWFEQRIVASKVLILDDIGKEFRTKTNLAESTFDFILRKRVVSLRPTIITTNMDQEVLENGYGAAIFSLLSERSYTYTMLGADWRPHARERTGEEVAKQWVRPIA